MAQVVLQSARMLNNQRKKHRVLVVDDEPLVCEAVTTLLEFDGHRVEAVNTGADALVTFKPGKFDLVITDFSMPAMTGAQLAAAIKSRAPKQPILLLTAFAERFREPSQSLSVVDEVMDKLVPLQTLREAIARLVSGCAQPVS